MSPKQSTPITDEVETAWRSQPKSSSSSTTVSKRPQNESASSEVKLKSEENECRLSSIITIVDIPPTEPTPTHSTPTHAYDCLLKPDKKNSLELWITNVPNDNTLKDAFYARPPNIAMYEDRIHWSNTTARTWLSKLNDFEHRYRTVGLVYHEIRYSLRHTVIILCGPKIEYTVLARMAAILETHRSRSRQSFFGPWLHINQTATDIINEVAFYQQQPSPQHVKLLRMRYQRFEMMLGKLPRQVDKIEAGLSWLEDAVTRVAQRADGDGKEQLTARHSREGTIFRQWIQTFPEIKCGDVQSVPEYTEAYVQRILEVGVERQRCWSMSNEAENNVRDGGGEEEKIANV